MNTYISSIILSIILQNTGTSAINEAGGIALILTPFWRFQCGGKRPLRLLRLVLRCWRWFWRLRDVSRRRPEPGFAAIIALILLSDGEFREFGSRIFFLVFNPGIGIQIGVFTSWQRWRWGCRFCLRLTRAGSRALIGGLGLGPTRCISLIASLLKDPYSISKISTLRKSASPEKMGSVHADQNCFKIEITPCPATCYRILRLVGIINHDDEEEYLGKETTETQQLRKDACGLTESSVDWGKRWHRELAYSTWIKSSYVSIKIFDNSIMKYHDKLNWETKRTFAEL